MAQAIKLDMFDDLIKSINWLEQDSLASAIVVKEYLTPADGDDATIFPPTFAVAKGALHPYQIDEVSDRVQLRVSSETAKKSDHSMLVPVVMERSARRSAQEAERQGIELNSCLIDSVGSQANRMENCFLTDSLSKLVPQITIRLKNKHVANLLVAGHRVADGAIRFSGLSSDVTKAIEALRDNADATLLAKLAPTSLVFGFWDSRKDTTGYKFGRIVSSTIRASNVELRKRSAQYNPTFDPKLLGIDVPEESEGASQETLSKQDDKDPHSQLGLRSAPAVGTHGGVRVFGQIVRRAQLNLIRIRALGVTNNGKVNADSTLRLRRYILGLSLLAVFSQKEHDLREGCVLVRKRPIECQVVDANGQSKDLKLSLVECYQYASLAAKEFGVGEDRQVDFQEAELKKAIDSLKKPGGSKKGK